MARAAPILLGLVILVPVATFAGEAEVEALGDRLLHEDMEVAHHASEELLALGADAKPALPQLLRALKRELDPGMARLHWHPWMALIRELHGNVLGTLEAIGPDASAAVPILAARLERGGRPHAHRLVQALIAVGPEKDSTCRVLGEVVPNLWSRLPAETKTRLRAWIEARGDKAIPLMARLLDRVNQADRAWLLARLVALQAGGAAISWDHLDSARPSRARILIPLLVKGGELPRELVPMAVRLFADEELSDDASVAVAKALAKLDGDVAKPLAAALSDVDPSRPPWRLLWTATPELARATSTKWFAGRAKADETDDAAGFDDGGLRRTPTRGGGGGGAFEDRLSVRATLVGLRVTSAKWSGHTIVTSIQPLLGGPEGQVDGSVHGQPRGERRELRAPQGYAVGGLYARGGHRVDGLAVVYFPWTEDGLGSKGAFVGPWVGGTGGGGAILLGGTGRRIVGIHGRKGADLDAVGLVEAAE